MIPAEYFKFKFSHSLFINLLKNVSCKLMRLVVSATRYTYLYIIQLTKPLKKEFEMKMGNDDSQNIFERNEDTHIDSVNQIDSLVFNCASLCKEVCSRKLKIKICRKQK